MAGHPKMLFDEPQAPILWIFYFSQFEKRRKQELRAMDKFFSAASNAQCQKLRAESGKRKAMSISIEKTKNESHSLSPPVFRAFQTGKNRIPIKWELAAHQRAFLGDPPF